MNIGFLVVEMATKKRQIASAPQLQSLPEIVVETAGDDTVIHGGSKDDYASAPMETTYYSEYEQQSDSFQGNRSVRPSHKSVNLRDSVEKLPPLYLKKTSKKRQQAEVSTCEAIEICESAINNITDLVKASLSDKQETAQLPKLRRTMTYGGHSVSGSNDCESRRLLRKFQSFDDVLPSKSYPQTRLAQVGSHVYYRAETPAQQTSVKKQETAINENKNVVWLKFKDLNASFNEGKAKLRPDNEDKPSNSIVSFQAQNHGDSDSEYSSSDETNNSVESGREGTLSRQALIGSATLRTIATPTLSWAQQKDVVQPDEGPEWPKSTETRLRIKNITKKTPIRWQGNTSNVKRTQILKSHGKTNVQKTKQSSKTDQQLFSLESKNSDCDSTKTRKGILCHPRVDETLNVSFVTSIEKDNKSLETESTAKKPPKSSPLTKRVSFIEETYSKYARRKTPTRNSNLAFSYTSKTRMGYLKSKLKKPEPPVSLGAEFEYDQDDFKFE